MKGVCTSTVARVELSGSRVQTGCTEATCHPEAESAKTRLTSSYEAISLRARLAPSPAIATAIANHTAPRSASPSSAGDTVTSQNQCVPCLCAKPLGGQPPRQPRELRGACIALTSRQFTVSASSSRFAHSLRSSPACEHRCLPVRAVCSLSAPHIASALSERTRSSWT